MQHRKLLLIVGCLPLLGCGAAAKPQLKDTQQVPLVFYDRIKYQPSSWLANHDRKSNGNWYHVQTLELQMSMNTNQIVQPEKVVLSGGNAKEVKILHAAIRPAGKADPLYVLMGECALPRSGKARCLKALQKGHSKRSVAEADIWVPRGSNISSSDTRPNYFSQVKPLGQTKVARSTNYKLYLEVAIPIGWGKKVGWQELTLFYNADGMPQKDVFEREYSISCKRTKSKQHFCVQRIG